MAIECWTFGCNNTCKQPKDKYCERCLKFGADKRMPRQAQVALDKELFNEMRKRILQSSNNFDFENNPPNFGGWK